MSQADPKGGQSICAIAGRPLNKTEQSSSAIEQRLVAALWGYKRYSKYCLYVPQVYVVLKDPTEVALVGKTPVSPRIQVQLLELSSLQVQYKCGEGAWDIQNKLARLVEQAPPVETDDLKAPVWEHESVNIDIGTTDASVQVILPA